MQPGIPFLALTLTLALAAPARAAGLPDPAETWIRADTAHLTLYSNASEEATLEIGRRVETFRAVLGRISPGLTADSPLPTTIFVFRNEPSFTPYKLPRKGEFSGLTANMDGYFVQHPDGNDIAVNATPDADPWPVIYHEYFHFFLYNNFTDIPLWFSEGSAECYGTFIAEGTEARLGGAIPAHVQWLREHPGLPLPKLFAVGFDSADYQEGERQRTFYAQSWALVNNLLWGAGTGAGAGAGTGGGPGFLRGLPRGGSLADALAPLVADPGALEQRLAAQMRARRFAFSTIDLADLPAGRAGGASDARVAPIGRAEVLVRLGGLLLHAGGGRLKEAEAHFREAIRLQPGFAAAHAGLGETLVAAGRRDEAGAALEKAHALDPADRAITMKLAQALVDASSPEGLGLVLPGDSLPPDLLRARSLLEGITRDAPDAGEAWAGLGSTYAYTGGDLAPGIAAVERARALLPSRTDLAANLCWLYIRSGQRSRARELYDSVVSRSGDAQVRLAGREALFWGDVEEAVDAIERGDAAAGLERLRRLAASAPSPGTRAQAEAQLRDSREFAARRGDVDGFNEAVRLANAGDLDGAAARLETLLAASPGPEVAGKARRLLSEVRAVRLFNAAAEKARQRDYRGALALLDRIPADVKDHPVVGAAAALRRQVKEAMDQPGTPQ